MSDIFILEKVEKHQ